MEKYLNNIAKWWVLITTAYIIIGLLKISLYYSAFGINIVTYCDLSEILTLWWPDAIFTLFFIILPLIFIVFLELVKTDDKENYHYYHFAPRLVFFLIIILILVRYILNLNGLSEYRLSFIRHSLNFILVIVVSFFALPVVLITTINYIRIYRRSKSHKFVYEYSKKGAYFCIAIAVFFSFMLSSIEIEAGDIDENAFEVVSFKSKADSIKSDNNIRLIGKTKNYIFFYDKKQELAIVYPMQDILKLTFQKIRNVKKSSQKPTLTNPPNTK